MQTGYVPPAGRSAVPSYMAPVRGGRRVIGPIPPRGKDGRFLIDPVPGKVLSQRKDKDGHGLVDQMGNPLMHEIPGDTRRPIEYLAYIPGIKPSEGATKGLRLFQIDLDPEPYALVYGRDAEDALRVYMKEFGVRRFGEIDPQVSEVAM